MYALRAHEIQGVGGNGLSRGGRKLTRRLNDSIFVSLCILMLSNNAAGGAKLLNSQSSGSYIYLEVLPSVDLALYLNNQEECMTVTRCVHEVHMVS